MKRTWTIIGVADVRKSFKWYQSLLGLPETAPAHDYFGQILDSDGTVLLCLHKWGAHEHPSLTSPYYAKPGNGLLLFFRVDNFDVARISTLLSRLTRLQSLRPQGRIAVPERTRWSIRSFKVRKVCDQNEV
jgi:catechol 2,3-dioxygenase-like lactoylglutathione lyase family enzyme